MMKKLFVALLVGAVAVGLAAPAFAADLKFTGAYRVRFMFDDNLNCFTDTTDCSGHVFQLRFRPRFEVETEGGVKGVLYFEIGDVTFGDSRNIALNPATATGFVAGPGGGADADGVNVETKHAYIDFPVPATPLRLRAGIQQFILSKALILDTDSPGLSLYGKLGEMNTNLFWIRMNDVGAPSTPVPVDGQGKNAKDVYGIDVAFSPTRDLSLNLYGVYTHDMQPATEALTGTWIGGAAAGKVQNIRWGLDLIYGSVETDPTTDQSGFLVFGNVGMAVAGTPFDLELVGWYATGDDGSGTDSDAFPIIFGAGPDTGAQIWSGAPAVDIDDPADSLQNTWALGVIARYTVNPNLRLTGNIHYIGTQEEGSVAAGDSAAGDGNIAGVDSVGTEFGIKADYTIARGLVFTLTASYLSLGDDQSVNATQYDDVTKVAGVLNYGF